MSQLAQGARSGLSRVEFAVVIGIGAILAVMVLIRMQESQTRRAFQADARVAIQALADLQSATKVRLLYADYARRVVDTNVVVDRFLQKWPKDLIPPLRVTLVDIMRDHRTAMSIWEHRIEGKFTYDQRDEVWGTDPWWSWLRTIPGLRFHTHWDGSSYVFLSDVQQALWDRAERQLKQARQLTQLR